jgi:pyruvate dehydrogenase E1 component
VFHAIQYLLGNQSLDKLQNFRAFGGAQSYPSRTKDKDDVDFSTGSVGLGIAETGFASLVQDYVHAKGWSPNWPKGRMIGIMGDAEIDEGNVHEALLEYWKHGLENCWWIIDYNRQSLDSVVSDRLFMKMAALFENLGWKVVLLKYGKLLQAAFAEPGGQRLKEWIDDCPNQLYSALVFQGGAAWRKRLMDEIGDQGAVTKLIEQRSDDELARLMNNLGGHDLPSIVEAFDKIDHDRPTCFIAYTVKGFGLPIAGHKDNHAGLMNPQQMALFQESMAVPPGAEWDHFAGLDLPPQRLADFLAGVPLAGGKRHGAARIAVPAALPVPHGRRLSTQEAFGRILGGNEHTKFPIGARS